MSCRVISGQGDKGVAGGTGFLHYSADGKLVWAPGPTATQILRRLAIGDVNIC